MKKLIAFYSRSGENYFFGTFKYITKGNTEVVADILSAMIDADIFKIEQEIPYSSDYKQCVQEARNDFQTNHHPALKNYLSNLDDYDEIFLGYPNYCGTMPMAVYTFLEKYDFTNKTIHPFCTHEGSGLASSISDIKKVAKGAQVTEGIAIQGSQAKSSKKQIENWIHSF